jgi:hypothetical protein
MKIFGADYSEIIYTMFNVVPDLSSSYCILAVCKVKMLRQRSFLVEIDLILRAQMCYTENWSQE